MVMKPNIVRAMELIFSQSYVTRPCLWFFKPPRSLRILRFCKFRISDFRFLIILWTFQNPHTNEKSLTRTQQNSTWTRRWVVNDVRNNSSQYLRGNLTSQDGVWDFGDFLDIAEYPYRRKISSMDSAEFNINKTMGRKWCLEQLFQMLRGKFIGQDRAIEKNLFSNILLQNYGRMPILVLKPD